MNPAQGNYEIYQDMRRIVQNNISKICLGMNNMKSGCPIVSKIQSHAYLHSHMCVL